MSVKRRDNRNRILNNGESQRPDGRYVYKYIDLLHQTRFLYSWRLVPTDKTPVGKKEDLSLREKIAQVERDKFDGIDSQGAEKTVLELVKLYISLRINVKPTTQAGYKTVVNILENEPFAHLPIKQVRHSVAKAFLVKLQQKDGRSYSSIHSIRGVLRPAFAMAVEDDYIRKNPFDFELAKVIVNDDVEYKATVVSMGARTEEIPEAYRNNLSKDHIAAIAVLRIDDGQRIPFWSLVNGMPVIIRFNNWEYEDVLPDEYLMLKTPKGLEVPEKMKNELNH